MRTNRYDRGRGGKKKSKNGVTYFTNDPLRLLSVVPQEKNFYFNFFPYTTRVLKPNILKEKILIEK